MKTFINSSPYIRASPHLDPYAIIKILALSLVCCIELKAHEYHSVDKWLKPPSGMEQLGEGHGEGHGEIDLDKNGLIYVSVAPSRDQL